MNPPLTLLRTSETKPAEFLASHPNVVIAIESARMRIQAKAKSDCDILAANLKMILNDWTEQHQIGQIPWASALDLVQPSFGLDFLAERLSQRLSQVRFEKFLETFCEQMLELDQAERRSQ